MDHGPWAMIELILFPQDGSPFIVCMTYAFQTPDKLCFILDLMNGEGGRERDACWMFSSVLLSRLLLFCSAIDVSRSCHVFVCMGFYGSTVRFSPPGGDLHYHLSQHGVFTEQEMRFYASEVILGLEHMHRRSVVYRDLKVISYDSTLPPPEKHKHKRRRVVTRNVL